MDNTRRFRIQFNSATIRFDLYVGLTEYSMRGSVGYPKLTYKKGYWPCKFETVMVF